MVNDFDSAIAAFGVSYAFAPGRLVNLTPRYPNINYLRGQKSLVNMNA